LNASASASAAGDEQVSIPQSGFGAFEQISDPTGRERRTGTFQSLSRDSGHLNEATTRNEKASGSRFNPSVGIRGI